MPVQQRAAKKDKQSMTSVEERFNWFKNYIKRRIDEVEILKKEYTLRNQYDENSDKSHIMKEIEKTNLLYSYNMYINRMRIVNEIFCVVTEYFDDVLSYSISKNSFDNYNSLKYSMLERIKFLRNQIKSCDSEHIAVVVRRKYDWQPREDRELIKTTLVTLSTAEKKIIETIYQFVHTPVAEYRSKRKAAIEARQRIRQMV